MIGYDSTNLADIPADAQLVLYYLNGSWPASAGDLARFPNAIKEGISVTPFANVGKWLDVETGDAFPWQAPDWIVMRRNAGQSDAGVYVEYQKWAATKTEFEIRGIPEPNWWIALWDGQAVLLPGTIGKQYAANYPGTPYYSGGHYDKSVFNYTFGPGGGTIASPRHGGIEDVTTLLTKDGAALQFGRGLAGATGKRGLYTRRLVAGAWSPWIQIQPGGDLGVDDLGEERIVACVDASGALSVTVTGNDKQTWYDTVSTDGGVTWSPFKNSGGAGDGLIGVSAGTSGGSQPPSKAVSGSFTGKIT